MHRISCVLAVAALCAGAVPSASAGELRLTIANGRVTLMAQEVPVRQILAEWARIGLTTIVNGDKVIGPAVTLQLVDKPEREVLEVLLKSAAGFMAAPRAVNIPNASAFDRIMILATSRPPAYSASAPPPPQPFNTRPMPQPQPDDDDQPVEQVPLTPPAMPPGMTYPGQQVFPGQQPGQPAGPLTAPRPGMMPAQPNAPPNPYGTPLPPGVRPPGGRGGGGQ